MTPEIFRASRYTVGPEFVTSNGDLYALVDIQHVRLRRPWLVVTGAACSGALALAAVFWPELYQAERAALIAACLTALTVSGRIGRLKLSSVVLRDGDGIIWGDYIELRALKHSVETALLRRRVPQTLPGRTHTPDAPLSNQET